MAKETRFQSGEIIYKKGAGAHFVQLPVQNPSEELRDRVKKRFKFRGSVKKQAIFDVYALDPAQQKSDRISDITIGSFPGYVELPSKDSLKSAIEHAKTPEPFDGSLEKFEKLSKDLLKSDDLIDVGRFIAIARSFEEPDKKTSDNVDKALRLLASVQAAHDAKMEGQGLQASLVWDFTKHYQAITQEVFPEEFSAAMKNLADQKAAQEEAAKQAAAKAAAREAQKAAKAAKAQKKEVDPELVARQREIVASAAARAKEGLVAITDHHHAVDRLEQLHSDGGASFRDTVILLRHAFTEKVDPQETLEILQKNEEPDVTSLEGLRGLQAAMKKARRAVSNLPGNDNRVLAKKVSDWRVPKVA